MFSCEHIHGGATYLGTHLSSNDYYEEGRSVTGAWRGKGAAMLGLVGKPIAAGDRAFEQLRRNINPTTGEALTERTREHRIAYYDWQCSAPKSVSVLAVTFGDNRLLAAHEAAVVTGFTELERFGGHRWAKDGPTTPSSTVTTGNLVAAAFTHDSSRELEAQLHTHFVVANATCAADGRWLALDNRHMYLAAAFAGRAYQNELATRCRALGYRIVEERGENGVLKGFQIAGVTTADMERQSTRRAQIEVAIARFRSAKGREPSARERHVMAVETRAPKLAETTTAAVRERQLAKYTDVDHDRLRGLVTESKRRAGEHARGPARRSPNGQIAREAASFAADHLLERSAVVTELDLVTCALANFAGRVALSDVTKEVRALPTLVRVDSPPSGSPSELGLFTTRENLARERELVSIVAAGKGWFGPFSNPSTLPTDLKPDQREALEQILRSPDRVVALRGPAGAGKTYVLKALGAALQAGGKSVVFVAPTHKAKQELQKEGFAAADTVAMFLIELEAGRISVEGKVLVVDESGMASTKNAVALLRAATNAGARVVLVGDEKQLRSVEPGDTLRLLKEHSPITFSELREIRRQRANPEYLRASQAMSEGRVRDGLHILDANGWIVEGGGAYLENAAADFLTRGDDAILVAPTWREVNALNTIVRASKAIGGEAATIDTFEVRRDLTAAQRRDGRHFKPGMWIMAIPGRRARLLRKGEWQQVTTVHGNRITLADGREIDLRKDGSRLTVGRKVALEVRAGDRVLLQQNDREAGLTNGTIALVTGIKGATVTIKLPSGKEVKIPDAYRMLTYGYAVTTEASQGATRNATIVAAARADDVRRYVALTRGRQAVAMHVPDKDSMLKAAANEIRGRPLALDHVASSHCGSALGEAICVEATVRKGGGQPPSLPSPTRRACPAALALVGRFLRRLRLALRSVAKRPVRSPSPALEPVHNHEPGRIRSRRR